MKYEAFISYRRDSASIKAELLRQMLMSQGLVGSDVFMDTHTLGAGDVKPQLTEAINQSKNFLLLITDGCCDHIKNDDLWMFEIATAQKMGVNMIPIFWSEKKDFPKQLSFLSSHNAVSYVHEYSDAFLHKLFLYLEHTKSSNFKLFMHRNKLHIVYWIVILLLSTMNVFFLVRNSKSSRMMIQQEKMRPAQPNVANTTETNFGD